MSVKIFRRGSARCIGLLSACITILLCLYYISIGQPTTSSSSKEIHPKRLTQNADTANQSWHQWFNTNIKSNSNAENLSNDDLMDDAAGNGWGECNAFEESQADIDTVVEYGKFDFQPEWMKTKEYWDKNFEARYEKTKVDPKRPPLKIIIVPHSHNDPGWLKTFVNYFQSDSRQIINLAVTKMEEFTNMTFIWSEISFLQMWWDQAHPTKQRTLKKLIQSGRFEITTGGWVMTDEANVHLYAMLDQLIEGHQWVKTNLNTTPSVGWSIDPFGHGSTVPYLLSSSGFEGAIIQRIHYAWKQWFAQRQYGDFQWSPYWHNSKRQDKTAGTLLTHNMPFDIYSIKHSCGPHPFVCLNFDFRKIPGEYTEYSIKAQFITDENIAAKADLLMEQYSRTASLFPHNVALIPVGDDFRYNKEKEVVQQYTNYKKLIDYINLNHDKYNTEISFGTPSDYFRAIKERYTKFPVLKGDFFVYADIFNEGRPAYWSGYFTTRPFYKILSRELEHNLRSVEILFTAAYNRARQTGNSNAVKIFEKNYEKMILARRNLGLFQHHDAITGTSKAAVMRDYGLRLFESIQDAVKIQERAIEFLIQKNGQQHNFLISELERDNFSHMPRKTGVHVNATRSTEFVVYNSLAQERLEVVLVRSFSARVQVLDANDKEMKIQINPVWNFTDNLDTSRRIVASDKEFEIMFVAKLPPLSLTTYRLAHTTEYKPKMTTIYCNDCKSDKGTELFEVRNKQPGDVQLDNLKMRLLFDEQTGFLKTVTKKSMGKAIQCAIKFGAYRSAQFHSGAYLFKPDREDQNADKDVLEQISDVKILITSGPIASDVTAIYGPFLAHTVRIYNTETDLDEAIYIENDIDFETPPKNRETELYMRFQTDIENGENPEFYSDLNGFQYQHRVKVPAIGIEGNYFPITSAAFMQDDKIRLTLMTTHAQGAASLEPGQMEVMLDRRTLYDDYRGMGEGIVDSRLTRHRFWLTLEQLDKANQVAKDPTNSAAPKEYPLPSIFVNQLINSLNYPANIYFLEKWDDTTKLDINKQIVLLNKPFPCDLHLLTLRTQTDTLPLFPSRSAFLVMHRQGYDCKIGGATAISNICGQTTLQNNLFEGINIELIESTTLTGLKTNGKVNSMSGISIEPMQLKTFNLTFVK